MGELDAFDIRPPERLRAAALMRARTADPAVRRYQTGFVKRVHKQIAAIPRCAGDGDQA